MLSKLLTAVIVFLIVYIALTLLLPIGDVAEDPTSLLVALLAGIVAYIKGPELL